MRHLEIGRRRAPHLTEGRQPKRRSRRNRDESRANVNAVVTGWGGAELRGCTLKERDRRAIAIVAPPTSPLPMELYGTNGALWQSFLW